MSHLEEARIAKMEKISDLADKYIEQEIDKGVAFSEGLCSWALNKAEQEIGDYKNE